MNNTEKQGFANANHEVNFDGLIGPTHNYAGLSHGNLASGQHARNASKPKEAALQGLNKMKFLHDLGVKQGVFIPQERPHLPTLRQFGFSGSDSQIIEKASKSQPQLLASCYSASSMWAANAATVSPSADTADGRVHFTSANLNSMLHRSIEHNTTSAMLRTIFANDAYFSHHDALQGGLLFGDEGAANHGRFFCSKKEERGVELFVFGRQDFGRQDFGSELKATNFPARQAREASEAVARLHGLAETKVVFAQQNPTVIDAGVFHNDVVSVANGNVLFTHELAFENQAGTKQALQQAYGNEQLHFIEVSEDQVSLENAVSSYLFNSQLINLPDNDHMALILPMESQENDQVDTYLKKLLQQNTPIKEVKFIDVRQSMQNGGGPACLRLRVALNAKELAAVNPKFLFDDDLHTRLSQWVNKHYRDEIFPTDLAAPALLLESQTALDELTQIFDIGSFYDFQRDQ